MFTKHKSCAPVLIVCALLLLAALPRLQTRAIVAATLVQQEVAVKETIAAQDENAMPVNAATHALQRLTNRDALERQQGAEELARLADPQYRNLAAGYRLQEKNARVKLALDWALYRMNKNESLFDVVRALDSSRADQAQLYLVQLESPAPLYIFLDRVNAKTQLKLFEVFARIGDATTLQRLTPYTTSLDPKIAVAAGETARVITQRLADPQTDAVTRPRQVGKGTTPTP